MFPELEKKAKAFQIHNTQRRSAICLRAGAHLWHGESVNTHINIFDYSPFLYQLSCVTYALVMTGSSSASKKKKKVHEFQVDYANYECTIFPFGQRKWWNCDNIGLENEKPLSEGMRHIYFK